MLIAICPREIRGGNNISVGSLDWNFLIIDMVRQGDWMISYAKTKEGTLHMCNGIVVSDLSISCQRSNGIMVSDFIDDTQQVSASLVRRAHSYKNNFVEDVK